MIAFCSVAFGEQYIKQQERLQESIIKTQGKAGHYQYTNEMPPGAKPFLESLYGFKVHAVKNALNMGFKKIIWCDTASILQKPVDYYFTLGLPIIAAKDDSSLWGTTCDFALEYFGNLNTEDKHLVGGSFYVFDFNHPDCEKMFNRWAQAEADGIFGSQEQMSTGKANRHRHDESCMALTLYEFGYKPMPVDIMKYNIGEESIVIKNHFK